VAVIASVVYAALFIFILIMWVRFIFDLMVNLNRGWRPRGAAVVIAEVAFTITDPPINLVRRLVPPLRFGDVSLDFGWAIVLVAAIILSSIVFRFL
jgi:YggT family protein